MITNTMRFYTFFALGTDDEYGQPLLSKEPKGAVKMAINITSQSVQNNINYENAQYLGLTMDRSIDDTCVISYHGKMLKVLYVNDAGKYVQVFMNEY